MAPKGVFANEDKAKSQLIGSKYSDLIGPNPWIPGATFRAIPELQDFLIRVIEANTRSAGNTVTAKEWAQEDEGGIIATFLVWIEDQNYAIVTRNHNGPTDETVDIDDVSDLYFSTVWSAAYDARKS